MLIAVPSFAAETSENANSEVSRNSFVGIRLHKNINVDYDFSVVGGNSVVMDNDPWGIGLTLGTRLSDNFKIEYELSYTGTEFIAPGENDKYSMLSNMFNAYVGKKFDSNIEPYVGFGLGFTNINAELDLYSISVFLDDSDLALSWQIMIGANFELSSRFDLNVGFKYQDFGKVKHTFNGVTIAQTRIDTMGVYAGFVYKFGL